MVSASSPVVRGVLDHVALAALGGPAKHGGHIAKYGTGCQVWDKLPSMGQGGWPGRQSEGTAREQRRARPGRKLGVGDAWGRQ
eukprot:5950765-Prymnesium_polylepis.1